MKKKRILVYTNGWSFEYVNRTAKGMSEAAKEIGADIFMFVNYSKFSDSDEANEGEMDIFRLPDPDDYDGVIVMANSFNMEKEVTYIQKVIRKITVPVVSMEYPLEGAINIMTDNYNGMRRLAEHLVNVHSVSSPVIMCGSRGHKEGDERLKALLDVFKERGVTVRDRDILYGNWARVTAVEVLNAWYEEEGRMPKAIICANDAMAEGACEWFESHDRSVPEDAIVTGYDGIWNGQNRDVPLTTVSHEWKKMGYEAVRILFDEQAREALLKKDNPEIILESGLMIGDSCGCRKSNEMDRLMMASKSHKVKKEITPEEVDSHFRHMYSKVRTNETAQQLSKSLAALMEKEHNMEGEEFALCLEKRFFTDAEYEKNLGHNGYGERMAVVCRLEGGKSTPYCEMSNQEIIFEVADACDTGRIYLFVPLQSEGVRYGYARITRELEITNDRFLYIWTRHIDQDLEQIQRNIKIRDLTNKLEQSSVTDFLTKVYNRAGSHKYMRPKLAEYHENGKTISIMVADVDRMKSINDEHGHACGDQALIIIADVLKKELPDDWMIARVGGDEFLIGGPVKDQETAERIRGHLAARIHERARMEQLKYQKL